MLIRLLFISLILSVFSACSRSETKAEATNQIKKQYNYTDSTEDFIFYRAANEKAALVIFPCLGCTAASTVLDFPIVDEANASGISVLILNYSQTIYLLENEKIELNNFLNEVFDYYQIDTNNVYLGGFSAGGNISLLMTDYLLRNNKKNHPKGLFMVDSPIDIGGLYKNALKNIDRNISEIAVAEAMWIKNTLDSAIGSYSENSLKYDSISPYTYSNHHIKNIESIKDIKLRFYSEPDTLWWKNNRGSDYKDLNCFYISNLVKDLKSAGANKIDYITTENKGYRSDGRRHPHSWSIVDKSELINWIKK